MYWNAVPEMIAALIILVLLLNSRDVHAMPSMRDRMFRFTLYYSLFSFLLNILSIETVHFHQVVPRWAIIASNAAYFAFYPLVTPVFIFYILLYAFERAPEEHRVRLRTTGTIILGSAALYLVIVLLNFSYGWLFSLDETNEYVRGPLNRLSLLLAMVHIVIGVLTVLRERSYLDKFFFKVLLWFPMLSLAIVIIQALYLEVVLTGSALVIAILSVYLNFQTKKISIDTLTEFPNRETFVSNLETIVRHKRKVTVVVASLDNFKSVNDTFGQKRGDLFLKEVANTLQQLCPKGQPYRYGGDELAIITDSTDRGQLVETIAGRFEREWTVDGITTRLSTSLALLELPFRADPSTDPITLIDHALRTAKNRGPGQMVRCDTMVLHTIRRKNQLSERLLRAIPEESLSLYYQPIFSIDTGTMMMAEALLRMETKELGPITPSEFIPLAEELGIIGELGRWVLEQVCILLSDFRSRGKEMPIISINFSSQQFSNPKVVKDILETIERYRIPPGKIILELTESTFIGSSFQDALEVMHQLLGHGIHFNLDDFGSGYSNLSYVVNLPFRCIKLDKSLLWDVEEKNRMHHLIESIIKVVRQIDYQVIVEEVENASQVSFLRSIECDMIQGYYLCPPLPRDEFTRRHEAQLFSPLAKLVGNPEEPLD